LAAYTNGQLDIGQMVATGGWCHCKRNTEVTIHLLGGEGTLHSGTSVMFVAPLRVTIVGGREEICRSLGITVDVEQQDLVAAVERATRAHLDAAKERHKQCPGHAQHAAAGFECGADLPTTIVSLRLLSPQEYAAEVGETQVALETKANPYTGAPAVYLP
jgi:hypothetical protein